MVPSSARGTRKFIAYGVTTVLILVFVSGCIAMNADAELTRIGVYGLLGALGLFVGGNAAEHLAARGLPGESPTS